MNCRTSQNLLSAYVDGELTGAEMISLRAHLSDCRQCRAEEQELRSLKRLLASVPPCEPPADLEERLVRAVMKPEAPRETLTAGQQYSLLAGITLAAASLTLLVLNFLATANASSGAQPEVIAYDVQVHDQTSLAGADPFGGGPVVPVDYGRR